MFIVIEGADGTGKSTNAKMLGEHLRKSGRRVINTAEPTKGIIGRMIRRVLSGEINLPPRALALLFTADRAEHVETVINPGIKEGVVICERYFYSTIAYQSAQGLDAEWLSAINSFAPIPDLVILLTLPPEEAISRIVKDKEVFEVVGFQEKVQRKLLKMSSEDSKRWVVVKANRPIDEVQQEIREIVAKRLLLDD